MLQDIICILIKFHYVFALEDYDQHMDMDIVKFAPFSEVLKKRKCVELVEVLGSFPKNAAENAARGPLGQSDFSLLNYAFQIAVR
ncbi:hypothetical protein niasHT_027769 [Heterodera trifolii]|uniref:Uncharacterized protein n=1 Tax=Heterodera trifolii TaxID=157864 RepID=A0ABD2KIC5_9BILA